MKKPAEEKTNEKTKQYIQQSILCKDCNWHTSDMSVLNCKNCNSPNIVLDELPMSPLFNR